MDTVGSETENNETAHNSRAAALLDGDAERKNAGGTSLFELGNIALSPFISAPKPTAAEENHPSILSGGGGVVATHPPIFMTPMNTHLSLDGFNNNDDEDDAMHNDGGEDHIAEQLAAGLLIDDGEDDIDLPIVEETGGHESQEEEKKVSEEGDGYAIAQENNPKGKMQFVKLPTGFSVGSGGNVVTEDEAQRQRRQELASRQEQHPESSEAASDMVPDNGEKEKKKRRNRRGKGKKKAQDDIEEEDPHVEEDKPEPITTSDAIKKLKQQEVSIGSDTKVQMKRSESALSLSTKNSNDDGSAPVINLLGGAKKITGTEKVNSRRGKKSKGKNKALGNDESANLRAARNFNRSVRSCVERSDPDGMADLLRDKRNHHFALDSHVLETVMKAYVMAAMFEDALYCLRNCTLPGSLSTVQTEKILECLPQNLRNSSAYHAADMINALCIATEFDQPTTRTYFMRIVRGIALEFLEEATSARDRICSAPCERLVRSASCVVDARLRRGKKATGELFSDTKHIKSSVHARTHLPQPPGSSPRSSPFASLFPTTTVRLDLRRRGNEQRPCRSSGTSAWRVHSGHG